ncbi:MAG: PAS domain S-box protein, partial [Candidatus Heimdallarchaeaceae archaeon]
ELQTNIALAELSRAILDKDTIEEIADLVLDYARKFTESDFGFVSSIDPVTGYNIAHTMTKDVWEMCKVKNKQAIFKKFGGLWGWVLENKKPLMTNNPAKHIASTGTPEGHLLITNFLSAPALVSGKLVGQIALANSNRNYKEKDMQIIEKLATVYALAIEQKNAQEALQLNEKLLSSIIDNSPSGYALEDFEGNLLRSNPALIQILGYSHDELKEKKLENLTHPEDKEISNRVIQKVINKEIPVADIEKRYIKKNGSIVPVRLTIWKVFNVEGKPHHFVGTIEDITEQLHARKRIKELNESLRIINDILRHDIGNNVSIIEGSIDAFFDIRDDAFLQMSKHAIDRSFDLIEKMESLEGLLIEDKKLEEIDVRKIVEKVIVGYTATSVSIKIEGNGIIIADNAISSVMDNLIGNAIKHGKADEIVVSINPGEHHCIIEVADNGKGVPEKYKKMLFRQGFKYGETAGSGLGLYIVKKTLERYGGDVTIRDNSPKGSIFQLKIKTPTT